MSEVRAFFDRWQRLETAKAEISDDLKELFAEAKATGFNTKAMRVAFRAKVKAENETDDDRELAAIVDLYLAEIDEPRARPASAREENIEEFPPRDGVYTHEVCFNAETGEIIEQPETAETSSGHLSPAGENAPAESASGEISAPIHPGPRTSEVDGGQPHPSPEDAGAKSSVGTSAAGQEPERAGHYGNSGQEPASAAQGGNEPASASGASATHSDDFTPLAFLNKPKTAADYRPHCQRPECCRSSGLHHCYQCEKALSLEGAAA